MNITESYLHSINFAFHSQEKKNLLVFIFCLRDKDLKNKYFLLLVWLRFHDSGLGMNGNKKY